MNTQPEGCEVLVRVPCSVGHGLVSAIRVGIWHCGPGFAVRQGQRLVELSIGSMTVTVHAPCDGLLVKWIAVEDSLISSDSVLGVIRKDGHGSTSES